jgi:heat shock protein HtpX
LADASSVMLTRYPEAMISALQKIAANPTLAGGSEATAHLFIYSPLRQESWMNRLFSTHPPLADRINALRQGAHLHV